MPTRLRTRTLLSLHVYLGLLLSSSCLFAQANFTAQLRGTVQDSSGSLVPGATVIITNEATNISSTITTDEAGRYTFNNLQPANYSVSVEAQGFEKLIQKGVPLRVSQQSVLNLRLNLGATSSTVEVHSDAVMLNSANAELGQEVTSRYITEMPLLNRQIEGLAFLAPGVTQSQGFATDQTNENFVSNGQRNSSSELRLDGSILSVPEAGEGGMFWSHYQPSVEIVEEFKVQTNGFSAEYGNNGGTVVNLVSKSGTNELHGSGYWFGQRSALNANDYFANLNGNDKPDYERDQFGGSLGGHIIKNKLFYFLNYDRTHYNAPYTLTTTVPTLLQKSGDFSQTFNEDGSLQRIFNPFSAVAGVDSSGNPDVVRAPYANNVIPTSQTNPIAARIIALYPNPTSAGDPITGQNNFSQNYLLGQPAHQYNAKVDWNIDDANRLSGRFSKGFLQRQSPTDFQGSIGQGDELNDYYNQVIEYTHTFSPTTVWTSRIGADRHHQTRFPDNGVDPTSVGFPSILQTANGSNVFPEIDVQNAQTLGLTGYTQTIEAQTQWVLDSTLSKVLGAHNLQFGGEQRILLSNFFQPAHPSGQFAFAQTQTMQYALEPDSNQGNGIASLLTGYASGGDLSLHPSVIEKSRETAFFLQDDWKASRRLTLNLGVRYEFSTPYEDRLNRLQIANFTADTGVNVPGVGEIRGVDEFFGGNFRHAPSDWNNIAPRLGAAFQLNSKTVLRGGAGVYYGVNYATSYQDLGQAYRKDLNYIPTFDNGLTQYATLANPFPTGNVSAQGTKYGNLNGWGFASGSNQSDTFRNSEIYQWAASLQRELPWSGVLEIAYSANRSSHLPDGGVRNRNYISTAARQQYGSTGLYAYVPNPFYPYFSGPNAVFNEPDSVYAQPTTQLINLLRPYPQFPGSFDGFAEFVANSWYNALQVKYEKRYSDGINIIASYTLAKATDDSSVSSNGWLGNSTNGVQDLNNLRGEYSASAADTRHRVVTSVSYVLPFGKNRRWGNHWNGAVDGVLGGWQVNAFFTLQTGAPIYVYMSNGRVADGTQRPNITGNGRSSYTFRDVINSGGSLNYFNVGAFSDPGDQVDGNEPRFNSDLRGDGLRNVDFSFFKNFGIGERCNLQLRGEFFNFTNTPRFQDPNGAFGSTNFGTVTAQGNMPRQTQIGARFTF